MRIRQHLVLCVIFVMPVLFFSACDQNSKSPVIPSPSPTATFAPLVIADSTDSSTPSAGAPQPSATYEPAPEFNADDVTIMILSRDGWTDAQKSSVNKLTKYLHKVNWNIRFSVAEVPTDKDGRPEVMKCIQEDLASGGRLQDAYIVDAGESEKLSSVDGFLMDLTKMIPEAAPVYYNRYKNLLKGEVYALPTHIVNQWGWNQEAFLCIDNGNSADADYQNISDVLTLLEKDSTKKIMYRFVDDGLINPWAFEQGYYPLIDYGMDGGIFADYNDKNCTPVLLEGIPGLADFAGRCRALLSTHQLVNSTEVYEVSDNPPEVTFKINKGDFLGYIVPIDGRTELFPISSFESNTIAYPISGGRPRFPDDKPDYDREIVIPSKSSRASDVMKFVEWVFLNSQNYDLVNYGEMGVDYQLVGGRYIPLINGFQIPQERWWGNSEGMVYVDSFDSPFFNFQYR